MTRRPISFRHIEAFRAVMGTGSMTEASRRLHTSQPQVSRLIGQLEAATGLPLFDREYIDRFSSKVDTTKSIGWSVRCVMWKT